MLPSQSNILYYGRPESLPEQIPLKAGPISLIYESGDLRKICLGDCEILQRIYVAVRDQNWRTIPMTITNLQIKTQADSFQITYDATHQQDDIDFYWQAQLTGDRQGSLHFEMDGIARSTFLRNRIGFCVLHPMESCQGRACTILKTDGTLESGHFPELIAPHQPFMDMAGITYEVMSELNAEIRFTGDVFEMEDQRNWTDASFKTYCTPLSRPIPAEVQTGTIIQQSVSLSLTGSIPAPLSQTSVQETVTLTLTSDLIGSIPRLGLGIASHGQPLSDRERQQLQKLRLTHLRLDLPLYQAEWVDRLRQATNEAQSLNLDLEIALILSDEADKELTHLVSQLQEIRPSVCSWLVFHQAENSTSSRWVELARHHLTSIYPETKLGAGSYTHFTELNRQRPPVEQLDLVSYAITPQVHAFDNTSLIENLPTQAITVASARAFIQDRPLAISPITLKPKPKLLKPFPTVSGQLPSSVDPRQLSLLGAAWTLGSLKFLLQAQVYSLTYYETTGWLGVMEQDAGSPLPEKFPSFPGAVFPLYHVLADVGERRYATVISTHSSHPQRVEGLTLQDDRETCLLIANLTHNPQSVRLEGVGEKGKMRILNEHTAIEAMQNPDAFRDREEAYQASEGMLTLTLSPYATLRLRWTCET